MDFPFPPGILTDFVSQRFVERVRANLEAIQQGGGWKCDSKVGSTRVVDGGRSQKCPVGTVAQDGPTLVPIWEPSQDCLVPAVLNRNNLNRMTQQSKET